MNIQKRLFKFITPIVVTPSKIQVCELNTWALKKLDRIIDDETVFIDVVIAALAGGLGFVNSCGPRQMKRNKLPRMTLGQFRLALG